MAFPKLLGRDLLFEFTKLLAAARQLALQAFLLFGQFNKLAAPDLLLLGIRRTKGRFSITGRPILVARTILPDQGW